MLRDIERAKQFRRLEDAAVARIAHAARELPHAVRSTGSRRRAGPASWRLLHHRIFQRSVIRRRPQWSEVARPHDRATLGVEQAETPGYVAVLLKLAGAEKLVIGRHLGLCRRRRGAGVVGLLASLRTFSVSKRAIAARSFSVSGLTKVGRRAPLPAPAAGSERMTRGDRESRHAVAGLQRRGG